MSGLETLAVTEDGFAFDQATGESYTLNSCGRLILQRLQNGENRKQIMAFISNEFGMSPGIVERDITDFLQQLKTLGMRVSF
jgi:hypothetical protein